MLALEQVVPEPLFEVRGGEGMGTVGINEMVTLRLRAFSKERDIPDLCEGDVMVGICRRAKRKKKKIQAREDDIQDHGGGSGDDRRSSMDEDEDGEDGEYSRGKEITFKIASIHWGLAPYINLLLHGADARKGGLSGRSASSRHAFAVCEVVDWY